MYSSFFILIKFKKELLVILTLLYTLIASPFLLSAHTTIVIDNQQSFDDFQNSLTNTIRKGDKEITIIISKGTYIAKENHISLQDIQKSDLKLSIKGNGAIIIPQGQEYQNGYKYVGNMSEKSSWMSNSQDIRTWSDVISVDGLIEILDEAKKQCRLKCKEPMALVANGASHILIPHWFQSSIYKIDKILGYYIYFTATDLKISYNKGYNVNDDYNFGKQAIRYKLLNAKANKHCVRISEGKIILPDGETNVREGIVNRLFLIQNCNLNSLELSGIKFYGNSNINSRSAIYFNNVNCRDVWVHDCEFRGMRSNVLTFSSSSNVRVENNLFADCYNNGIQSDNNCRNTVIKDNTFMNMGKSMQNSFCIVCRGDNFHILGNKMTDFGYGGIGVGVWYKNTKNNQCAGLVENNELSYSEPYVANIIEHGIMDSGAIYVWTKTDGVVIRHNYIHNYSGAYGNRGIFCDDGAYNYQIYGNIIMNVPNSYCIASRREASVEMSKTPESGIVKSNVNNVIRDNIIDGDILFAGHEDINNGCVKGANYILMKKGGKAPKNTIRNIVNPEEDIPLEFVGLANGKLYITSQSYRKLKKSKSWNNLRKYVGKY